MKGQWGLILALVFALIVAIFAVINVETVTVDYLFGTAQWPLVLVILASALVGGLAVGGFGIFRIFRMRREIRALTKRNQQLKLELEKTDGSVYGETPVEDQERETEQPKESNQEKEETAKPSDQTKEEAQTKK